ncbi:hypothetical protein OIV19_18305 [Brucella sp. HL-2]|nr:hypothetical protein [Brucella sp. HL-2]MCV9909556.1 hypothetical protein [Brucella sp. HL-2]
MARKRTSKAATDSDDVMSAMDELDALEAKPSGEVDAVDNATDPENDASTLDDVEHVDQTIHTEQKIHSSASPLVMVLPDAAWFVEAGEGGAVHVSSVPHSVVFGYSEAEGAVSFCWPDYNNKGLASFAYFKAGEPNFSFFKSWPDYLMLGSLVYSLQSGGDSDGLVRVLVPGYSTGSVSLPEILNRISSGDGVASDYPREPLSDNGSPIRIITEIEALKHSPFSVASSGCLSVAWDEGSFVSLRDHSLSFEQIISLLSSEIIGEPFTLVSSGELTDNQHQEIAKLVASSPAKFTFSDNSIAINPHISVPIWLENIWNNAED